MASRERLRPGLLLAALGSLFLVVSVATALYLMLRYADYVETEGMVVDAGPDRETWIRYEADGQRYDLRQPRGPFGGPRKGGTVPVLFKAGEPTVAEPGSATRRYAVPLIFAALGMASTVIGYKRLLAGAGRRPAAEVAAAPKEGG